VNRHLFRLTLLLGLLLPLVVPAQVFLNENFNTGIPATWTVVNGGTTAATWTGTVGGYSGATLDGTEFAFVNSDAAGNFPPVWVNEQLKSPVLNTAGAGALLLEYDHYFKGLGQTDSGHVEVFDGAAWVGVAHYGSNTGAFSSPAHVQINVAAYANANFQVRFRYDDDTLWAWYWAVDNVQLYAPTPDDASLNAVLSPTSDGRLLTQSALGAAVPVSLTLRNTGSTTISNVPLSYRINGGLVVGPEIFAGPLVSNASQAFTFTATANLSAAGIYAFEAWTSLPGDVNPSNDTLRFRVRQWDNQPLLFPHCQNFELASDTALQTDCIGLSGVPELDFTTSRPTEGRLRTFAGPGYAQSGFRALTLDRNPTGSPDARNAVIFTYNLAGLQAANDQVLLDLSLMEHGDEVQSGDSIWIRGCDACTWLRIAAWNDLSFGNNGVYFHITNYDLSATLAAAGQQYSASFQIKVGQEDNFNTATLIGSDGLSIDDLCLRRVFQQNASPVALLTPRSGNCGDSAQVFTVVVQNAGRDTLFGFPVGLQCAGAANGSLSGIADTLLPGQLDTLVLGSLNTFGGGTLYYSLITSLIGDEYLADDSLHASLELLGLPIAPVLQGDTVCIGGAAQLQVLNPQPGQVYYWYDQLAGGTLLDSGATFSTPPVTGPDFYYAEARHLRHDRLGPPNNAFGSGGPYAVYDAGFQFDAYQDFVLDSLSFYPGDTGLVSLVLRDSAGLTLDSLTWYVQPPAPYALTRVPVGFQVPAGVAHELRGDGSTLFALWRNSSGATYPYTVDGTAAITAPLNALSGYYYFWYDLRITYPDCPGPRAAVGVDTTSVPATAAFLPVIQGLSVNFNNTSNRAFGYLWDFGDGNTSTAANPAHSYAINDTFRVCLIAFSPCGNDTTCQDIIVDCPALAPVFGHFSINLQAIFVDSTVGAVSRFWYFGDGTAGISPGPSIVHVYPVDDIYNVCLRVTDACGDTAMTCDSLAYCRMLTCALSYTVSPDGLTYTFTPFSPTVNLTSYLWDFGDGTTSTLSHPVHTYLTAGTRVVRLTVTNICGEMAYNPETIHVVVGVASPLSSAWQVSPNPSEGRFVLDWGGYVPLSARVQVMDAQGRVLAAPIDDLGAQGRVVDLRGVPAGMYFLAVEAEGVLRRFRLVKM
jgi:PKD repeat protein